ncbi:MAG: Asp-tRNA(Asn)/Glu-tRNA(Gln) amidotransferase A subunit family amidase [Gammaproteobacteria bacterium]|jgi:Asp-tRNA(Asn)/Glu-tRNA(Gln) amidotransferase A subunit family amidase
MIQPVSISSGSAIHGSYDPLHHQRLSFSDAVANFKNGSDTPRAFLERCLQAYFVHEPQVRAFAYIDIESARRAADASSERYQQGRALSPVDGCPVAFKDTIETADMPTQQNSAIFTGWIGKRDAACVWALRNEGAIILGKTQVPEFALGQPPTTRSPFDSRRTAGGSSSGSGASVGAGMVPVAIGNQTMGSLIRPASFNANYGFKPTWGALNVGGMHPLAPSLDHIGPMAATLADMWLIAQRISYVAGGHNGHPGLTGGPQLPPSRKPRRLLHLQTLGWTQIDDPTREAFESIAQQLRAADVAIDDATNNTGLAELERMLLPCDDIATDICMYELRWPMAAYAQAQGKASLGDAVLARLEHGLRMTPDDYRQALHKREAIRCKVLAVASGTDGFISLASSGPAPLLELINSVPATGGQAEDGSFAHLATGSRSFLSPWSMVGGPSLALPWMAVDGMPLGVQLMGVADSDFDLVGVARWADGE